MANASYRILVLRGGGLLKKLWTKLTKSNSFQLVGPPTPDFFVNVTNASKVFFSADFAPPVAWYKKSWWWRTRWSSASFGSYIRTVRYIRISWEKNFRRICAVEYAGGPTKLTTLPSYLAKYIWIYFWDLRQHILIILSICSFIKEWISPQSSYSCYTLRSVTGTGYE